ncbi:MAG: aminotransferase class V-fold PLP-dependent enzyme [Deltaproteobacteria bacterium]|nr:aminotransferase class V-fold PLP-dependent enzyme [Deltaproteobacteria bacterium]
MKNLRPIYLDHHATTPVDPRVFRGMEPYFCENFGNAASKSHLFGWKAEGAVEKAREQVAQSIQSSTKEIVWTSGATEANNLALIGIATAYQTKGDHLITCSTEHSSILDPCRYLQERGFKITTLPVNQEGMIDLDDLTKAFTKKTILVSLMAANNEVGTLHPTVEIGKITRKQGVLLHIDAAQGCGKIPVTVQSMGVDLLSLSAHKVYGPKGVGALYLRKGVRPLPLFYGGGHERGFRSGTLPVPLIVGMGEAFEIAGNEMETEARRLKRLRDQLFRGLTQRLEGVVLNGPPTTERLPGNLNVSFEGIDAEALMAGLPNIAVSSGAACTSAKAEPSHVLRAMGLSSERIKGSVRFGLGRFTTEEEIDHVIEKVVEKVQELRKKNPLLP